MRKDSYYIHEWPIIQERHVNMALLSRISASLVISTYSWLVVKCLISFIHFPDDIFKCIFLNENVWISIKNFIEVVPKVPINNIPALVQIMAWRRLGDKPLYEPMIVSLLTHICVMLTKLWWPRSMAPYGVTSHHEGRLVHFILDSLSYNCSRMIYVIITNHTNSV